MEFEVGSFLGKHARFYLLAAREATLAPLTDSPELLAGLEQGYAALMRGLGGTPLEPFAQAENAAILYHGWMAEGARADSERGGTRLSTRYAPEDADLNNLLDEISLTRDVLADSIAWGRTLRDEGGTDTETLLLLRLNQEIVERKEDHLSDPGVVRQLRELRTLAEGLRVAAGGGDPLGAGRTLLCRIVGSVFLAYTLYRTYQAALDDMALFAFRNGSLRLRPQFADPAADGPRLTPASAAPAFLEENLEALARARTAFREAAARLAAEPFSDAAWTPGGELKPFPLLLAQLWDDRGLLGRVAAGDLCRLCRGEGPLSQAADEAFVQAGSGVRGLLALGHLAGLADEARAAVATAATVSLEEALKGTGPLLDRVAVCEKAVQEGEQVLGTAARRLRDEVSRMNIDHSGLLDPAIENLLSFLPENASLNAPLARDLLFFSRRAGALYEPAQSRLDEARQHCRYLRELHFFQEGQLLECQRLIEENDPETARTFFAELEWVFDDLDYAAVGTVLGMGPRVAAS